MTTEVSKLVVAVDSNAVDKARDRLGRFVRAGQEAAKAADAVGAATSRGAKQMGAMQTASSRIVGALNAKVQAVRGNATAMAVLGTATRAATGAVLAGVAAAGAGTVAYFRLADTYANMNAKIKLVTDSAAAQKSVMDALFQQAQRTSVEFESQVTLYARLAQSSDELRANSTRLLGITESISKAMVVSGASQAETASAVRQLSQAMASGVLRGDEFNSMMENAPRLAKALADGLGVPVGALRKMAEEGQLTSKAVITAIESQGAVIDKEFRQMPLTVGRATQQVKNALLQMVGVTDQNTQASQDLAKAIQGLAKTLSDPQTIAAFQETIGFFVRMASAAANAVGALREYFAENSKKGDVSLRNRATELWLDEARLERQARNPGFINARRQLAENRREQQEIERILRDRERARTDGLVERAMEDSRARNQPTGPSAAARSYLGAGKTPSGKDRRSEQERLNREMETAAERLREQLRTEEERIRHSYAERAEIIRTNTKLEASEREELARRNAELRDRELADLKADKMRELETIRESLLSEEERVRESYARRRAIIEENASPESKEKLLAALDAQTQIELQALEARKQQRALFFEAQFADELSAIRINAEIERLEILTQTELTETQRAALIERLRRQTEERVREFQQNAIRAQMDDYSAMFGGLASLTKAFGGEQSKAYKRLFALQKGFAIASAAVNIAQGVSAAIKLGWPAMIPGIAAAIGQGATVLAQIRSSSYSGEYDEGGYIPARKWGIVGERGPEIVAGPAQVTSRKDTARIMRDAAAAEGEYERRGPRPINVNFVLATGQQVDDFRRSRRQVEQDMQRALKRNTNA